LLDFNFELGESQIPGYPGKPPLQEEGQRDPDKEYDQNRADQKACENFLGSEFFPKGSHWVNKCVCNDAYFRLVEKPKVPFPWLRLKKWRFQ
jgi:hypothetical protein